MPPPARVSGGGSPRSGSAERTRLHLLDLLGPVVAAAGYDLEDLTVTAAGRRNLVRVVVDGDGGVDLDAVAEVSRAVSQVLDAAADANFAGPYVLEVTSPGVDRPLTEPRHWRRAVGRLVQVPVAGRTVTARVVAASDTGVTLESDGARRDLAYADLGAGRVQVEFNRPHADDGPEGEEG